MNSSRTIQVSELGLPDESIISKLSADDVRRTLSAPASRGYVICYTLSAIGFAGFVIDVLFYHKTTLAVGSIIWATFFRILAELSHQKIILARRISVEPQQVFWAHPCRPLVHSRFIKHEGVLTLHSRTGQSLEVAMTRKQMLNVVEWFKRQNSDIRIGNYDTLR